MILTGYEIHKAVQRGEIIIEPYNTSQLNTSSYDFKLGNKCIVYKHNVLDTKRENETIAIEFNENGLMLDPAKIYLINTFETMGSNYFVPIIRGRSSIGRLGIFIDITADLIDLGSINRWTLQLKSTMLVKVYPGMLIGQVTFWTTKGEIKLYNGKYKGLDSPTKSLSFKDKSINE